MIRSILVLTLLFGANYIMAQVPNSWVRKADYGGLKRERAVAFSANGFGFVGTGIDTAENVLNDFWKYDPTLDTWTQVATLPGAVRRNSVGFTLNDRGYVATGMNTATSSDIGATTLSDMWRYDPVFNSWTQVSSYPGNFGNGVYFAAAFTAEGKAYVVGGKHGPNNYSSAMYSYDPNTDQWSSKASFPGGVRYQLSALSIDDKGYVGLGTDQDLYRNDWWEYKTSTNTWAQRADLPASERASAVTFTIGSSGFVCMGTNGGVLDDLWEYNPYSNTWTVRAPYGGSARKNAVAFAIGSSAYVGTGKGISGKKQSMHQYFPMSSLGVDELAIDVSVYPNPVVTDINVKSTDMIDKIVLSNINGREIRTVFGQTNMNVADINAGNYLLTIFKGEAPVSNQTIVIL